MRVVWTPEALQDRDDIWFFIAADNPGAASRLDAIFSDAAERLANHPNLGRIGRVPGTCELVLHENYRLIHEINGQTLWMLALVHTARQWPPVWE